ncbi:MAG TPA: lytic transglycosylase domain-containing protein [Geobacteraceae bacterium]|nr:lytic transglycosylase domain-containing protein [Geobacteraceae bacterium]
MSIDAITANTFVKPNLHEVGTGTEGNRGADREFGRIFAASLSSVKSENIRIDKDKAATVAELIQLEMMRNSLTLGEDNAEPPQGKVARTLSLFMNSMSECGTCSAAAGKVEEEQGHVDVQTEERGTEGIDTVINRASRRYGIDAGLIKAVIRAESNFNPRAVSSAGAEGLMQLMPATARGLGVSNSFDPEQNVMAGTRFLKDMLVRYDGDLNSALAAYNWGPGNVDKRTGTLPRETREYLIKVKEYYAEYTS